MHRNFRNAFVILLAKIGVLHAAAFVVTGITQIPGAIFYDASATNVLATPTLLSVKITPDPFFLSSSFASANAPQLGLDVPGSGDGFGSDPTSPAYVSAMTFDFSKPVSAFGATFIHFQDLERDPAWTFPVTLRAFSGPHGSGTLLGTVTDPGGGTLQGPPFADFRGLWTSSLNIASAEISVSSPPEAGFAVDGYAISISTPEPTTLLLVGSVLAGLGIARCAAKPRKRSG